MREKLNQILGYLHGMWAYRWTGLLVSWIVAMIGWVAVLSLPDRYESKAMIYIDTSSIMKPLLQGLAVEQEESDELTVINRMLMSRENLLAIIREIDKDIQAKNSSDKEKLIASLASSITLSESDNRKGRRDNSEHFYQISYQSESAQEVYQVVSILLNTAIEKLLGFNRTDTAAAQKFLNDQIVEYEERLKKAEQRLAAFKRQHVGMMPDEQGGYYQRLQSAQDQVDTLRQDLRLAQQRYNELTKQLKGEKPLLGDTFIQASDNRLQEYKEQLDLLLRKYTDAHPDVQSLRALIQTYEESEKPYKQQDGVSDSPMAVEYNPVYQDLKLEISNASVEIEALKLQLSEQQARVEKLKGLINEIPHVEAELAELNRDYEVSRERYIALVERRESARLAELAGERTGEVKVSVIEPPIMPDNPIGPNRRLFLLAVLFVALAAGLGWCILRYMLNPTITNTAQIKDEIELPVFGSVRLYITPQHKAKRIVQFAVFMLATICLVAVASGLVWKQEMAVEFVRDMIEKNNIVNQITETIGISI